MRIALKAATAVLAALTLLAQLQPVSALLACNQMNFTTPNTKLRGVWMWAVSNQPLVVCSTYINVFGQTSGGGNQCVGPAQWPTTGTLTGNIKVLANCRVTGTLTLNVPSPGISQTYTVNGVLQQQAPSNTANIIMGALVQAGRQYYFWMIQST